MKQVVLIATTGDKMPDNVQGMYSLVTLRGYEVLKLYVSYTTN